MAKDLAHAIDEALRTFLATLSSAGNKLTEQIADVLIAERKPPEPPPPEPCPRCGEPWNNTSTYRTLRDTISWKCGSCDGPQGFSQTILCELRQLRAACQANGMMHGGWPVVVEKGGFFVFAGKAEYGKIRSMRRSQCGHLRVELQTASGIWWRRPDQLWHTREEAERALATGGGG